MKSKVILSAIGSDRPGLTQQLADAVFQAGGNWLDGHLSRLGGKYVGAVLVELEPGGLGVLEQAVREIDAAGLHISIIEAGDEPPEPAETVVIELIGQDHPGIVRELTTTLTKLGINIEHFSSTTENSAWSGGAMFRASARITLPSHTSAELVHSALEDISHEIMVDISVTPGKAQLVR